MIKNRCGFLLLFLCLILVVGGCSSAKVIPDDQLTKSDPWENINRKIFTFNEHMDKYILKPAAQGYDYVMPNYFQERVRSFLSNLGELWNLVNNLLQLEGEDASVNFIRFAMNSTFGILGLFDIASETGIPKAEESLGLTLAKWGVGRGNYLMLPFLGPTTTREGAARLVGFYAYDPRWPVKFYGQEDEDVMWQGFTNDEEIGLFLIGAVQFRSDLLKFEDNIKGDRYTFIREAYLQILANTEQDHYSADSQNSDEDSSDPYADDPYADDPYADDPYADDPYAE